MVFVKHRCNTHKNIFSLFFFFFLVKIWIEKVLHHPAAAEWQYIFRVMQHFLFERSFVGFLVWGPPSLTTHFLLIGCLESVSFKSTSCWHGASKGLRLTPTQLSWCSHDHIKKHTNSWHQLVWTRMSSRVVVELVISYSACIYLIVCPWSFTCGKMQKHTTCPY